MGAYPYAGSEHADNYWKYKNKDSSTSYYGMKVACEIIDEIQEKIRKRGKDIYGVGPKAIIVQDLVHEATRQLTVMLNEDIKEIEKLEQNNSGDITNYFGPDSDSENEEGPGEGDQA